MTDHGGEAGSAVGSKAAAGSSDPERVHLERLGAVVRVTLDRPPLNVLDIPMLAELRAAIASVAADAAAKVLVVTGAGKAFCAGVDVADHTADRVADMLHGFHEVLQALTALEVPVVAAVNGAALGGGMELLLACDVVLAREDARLGQPEIRLGVFPPFALAVLPRLIGPQRALDLILSGRVVDGREGVALGLVSQALPADGFAEVVERYAAGLAALSGPVLRLTRRTAREVLELPKAEALAAAERVYLDELMRLQDPHEGLAAFLQKRAPVWKEA